MNAIEILPQFIRKNTILRSNKTYVAQGEVRILKNIQLTIQDQVTILLVNGVFKKSCIKRSALIFNQGSRIKAAKVHLMACNEQFKPVKYADNGGIWFLGSHADASKDGVALKINRNVSPSNFSAKLPKASYLGREDEYRSAK